MADRTTPPRRRWFCFSLRTLFVAVTLLAVIGWLGWNLKQVRERSAVRPELHGSEIRDRSDAFVITISDKELPTGELPWLWRQFGARHEQSLYLKQDEMSDAQFARIRRLFPEAKIWVLPRRSYAYTRKF